MRRKCRANGQSSAKVATLIDDEMIILDQIQPDLPYRYITNSCTKRYVNFCQVLLLCERDSPRQITPLTTSASIRGKLVGKVFCDTNRRRNNNDPTLP